MALPNLTPLTELATYKSTKTNRNPVVQVIRIEKMERHNYKLWLSDGSDSHDAYIECALKKSKHLEEGSIVRLWEYLRAKVGDTIYIKILDFDVIPNIMSLDLTLRPIRELETDKSTRTNPNPVVQVIEVKKTENHKYKLLSDGFYFHEAYVDGTLKKSKQLEEGFIVRLDEYLRTSVDIKVVIKVLDIDVIRTQCDIIGHPKPFPYSATPLVEDYYHVSLPPDVHPILNGLFSLPQRNLNDLSASEKSEKLKWGTETTEDVVDYIQDNLPEGEHPLLKGSCISVEDQLEWGTETEDGFLML